MKKRALGIMLLAVDAIVIIAAFVKDMFTSMFNPFDITAFIIMVVAIVAAVVAIVLILSKDKKSDDESKPAKK